MAYQQFYGNPYSPGVASGVMEGAKKQTDFARNVQRARLRAESRRLSLSEAKFEWQKSDTELAREMEAKRFEATLQQRMQTLKQQRRSEQRQQQQFEQQHKLRRDKFDLDVRNIEQQNQLREEAKKEEAELKKLKAAGTIEEAAAEQRQAEIDAKKARGDQMIRSIQSGAVPVPEDYQLQEGEYEFTNPLTGQRSVVRKPSAGGAQEYTPYQKQNIRLLDDQIAAAMAENDTKRERMEKLEAEAADYGMSQNPGLQAFAQQKRKQAKEYEKEIKQTQDELASLHAKRREMVEGVLEPERRKMEQYEPGPKAEPSAKSAAERIQEEMKWYKGHMSPEEAAQLTVDEVIKYMQQQGLIVKRKGVK